MSLLIDIDQKAWSEHPVIIAIDLLRHHVTAVSRGLADLLGLLRRGLAEGRTCGGLGGFACATALQNLTGRRSCLRAGFFRVFHDHESPGMLDFGVPFTTAKPIDLGPIHHLCGRMTVRKRIPYFSSLLRGVPILIDGQVSKGTKK